MSHEPYFTSYLLFVHNTISSMDNYVYVCTTVRSVSSEEHQFSRLQSSFGNLKKKFDLNSNFSSHLTNETILYRGKI